MRLPPARLEAFLDRPDPEIGLVLLFGPDAGLVAERAERLGRSVVPDLADPFRVSEVEPDRLRAEPQRLALEAQALCFLGGRRLVRVRGADDGIAKAVELLLGLERIEALVVIEAGDLAAGSKLRQLAEKARGAVVIGCWPEGERERARTIRALLAEHGLEAEPEALAFLIEQQGADRAVLRSEIAKLALYLGPEGDRVVRLADAAAVVGDGSALAFDDVVLAALSGDRARLERDLLRLLALGEAPVRILRTATGTVLRLLRLRAEVERGASIEAALATARPPVHFRLKDRFAAALGRWSSERLVAELGRLVAAEAELKSTGRPDILLLRRTLAELADRAPAPATSVV
ncbi:MAG: DNA polymerase III subunit delta [Geminicoccaceae bacterium]|nr:MAG: DNA polymerase III subunit delta [Geminicoccaceae bacterium]